MGRRSPSNATQQAKRRCRRDKVATLPAGETGEGGEIDAITPASNTPCIADTKAWTVASDRISYPSPVAEGGMIGYPTPPRDHHPTCTMDGSGVGGFGRSPPLDRHVVV